MFAGQLSSCAVLKVREAEASDEARKRREARESFR